MDGPTHRTPVRQVTFAPASISHHPERLSQYHRTFAGPTGLVTVWSDRVIPDEALIPLVDATRALFPGQLPSAPVDICVTHGK